MLTLESGLLHSSRLNRKERRKFRIFESKIVKTKIVMITYFLILFI